MSPTPIVTLRARTQDDLDLVFELARDLDTWDERTAVPPRPLTREEFDARLASESSTDVVNFIVVADGVAVGTATLFDFDYLARNAEAGISLVPTARGRGIGTAAVTALVEFGFVRRNLHRIHLQAIASNTAAIRAYEKAGFVIEGRQREHAWVRGGYQDIVRMGILRADLG